MRRAIARLMALSAVAVGALAMPMASRAAVLAATPYMGWNTYYGVGGYFDEATIKSVASTLISSGLAQAGYRIVWLDFGWTSGARDSTGQLTVDPTQWPDGMAGLTAWLHQQGLEAGIYTDAGQSGCNGQGVGSYGHYQQDADTFAEWGFDAVKVDFCGAGQQIADGQLDATPQQLYTDFSQALSNNSSGRPMILNVDNFWSPGAINGTDPAVTNSSWQNFAWAPQVAQSWRTDTDIGFTGDIQFQWVLRNLDQDAADPAAAGPPSPQIPWGHWNDPDYLGPGLGMSDTEAQSQFSMWAMLAAPLILGSDPRSLSPAETSMLENPSVIAVDQDSFGAQGTLVQQAGSAQAWAKPLASGDSAVALLNRGTTPLQISTTAAAVGLPQASSYTMQDLWTNATTTTAGQITALVPAHGVALYLVSASDSGSSDPPGTAALTIATVGLDAGTVSDGSGAISCPASCSADYPLGSAVTLTASPTTGATFAGWHGGGCSGTAACTTTINADTRITATFVPAVNSLSVSVIGVGSVADATGAISCPGSCSASYTDGTITLTAHPSADSAFAGWSGGGCSGSGACTVSLYGDTAVSATFTPIETLTVSVDGGGVGTIIGPGISCPSACSASYPDGTVVTLTASPAVGSGFGSWQGSGCPEFGNSCTVTLTADGVVTATFDAARSGTAYVVSPANDTVTPIHLAADTAGSPIGGFDVPRDIAIAPDGGTAYVVNSGDGTVTPIDLATDTTEPRIRGFHQAGPIAISPSGRTAYVLEGKRKLVAVDLTADRIERTITFSNRSGIRQEAASIAISPNGRIAYIGTFTRRGGASKGSIAAINLSTYRVKATIDGFAQPAAIALTPKGKTAYVADSGRGNVTPINLATNHPIRATGLTASGAFPGADAVVITPNGKTAYIAGKQMVGTIDVTTNAEMPAPVTGTVAEGGIALTSNGGTAYVIDRSGGVIPIDVATNSQRPELTGLGRPAAIAIASPPSASYSVRFAVRPNATGSEIRDAVTCLSSTRSCTTVQTVTVAESSSVSGAVEMVVVGSSTARVRAGQTVRVVVRLDSAGRRLLGRLGSLPVVLSLAIRRNGHADTVMTRSIKLL